MSTGELGRRAPVGIDRCGNMCPICDRTWHTKQHRPVSKANLIAWFRSSDFYRHMPLSAKDNTESLTNLLWNGKETWIFSIFKLAKSTLNKYNVECLMQSLIAATYLCKMYIDYYTTDISVIYSDLCDTNTSVKSESRRMSAANWRHGNGDKSSSSTPTFPYSFSSCSFVT